MLRDKSHVSPWTYLMAAWSRREMDARWPVVVLTGAKGKIWTRSTRHDSRQTPDQPCQWDNNDTTSRSDVHRISTFEQIVNLWKREKSNADTDEHTF
ncbi:hypothetical protein L210DRAFT_2143889 [Boletus edulis BED1]|uniref:Uncharacterized protein n=1 Tax=Boletus edulis BED1 TaxID=1328754 RepID=A0AAD4BEQ1_BOLED|nr:hypothetical protein L210DRAFT_2143889 [Boletus edulis BED1]